MECLTPTVSFDIFMDSYFTSFGLFIHLGINKIRATGVLNKNWLHNALDWGQTTTKKKEWGHFEQRSANQAKK